MNWSDVVRPPSRAMLRQFAAIWLVFFVGLASWRAWERPGDSWAVVLAVAGVVVGTVGLVRPSAVRFIYTGWLAAAFPIGWTISRVILAALFYVVFTPVAIVFRVVGRDALRLRKTSRVTYWTPKGGPAATGDYLRQF